MFQFPGNSIAFLNLGTKWYVWVTSDNKCSFTSGSFRRCQACGRHRVSLWFINAPGWAHSCTALGDPHPPKISWVGSPAKATRQCLVLRSKRTWTHYDRYQNIVHCNTCLKTSMSKVNLFLTNFLPLSDCLAILYERRKFCDSSNPRQRQCSAGFGSACSSSVTSPASGFRLAFPIALTVVGYSSSRVQSSLLGSGVRGPRSHPVSVTPVEAIAAT